MDHGQTQRMSGSTSAKFNQPQQPQNYNQAGHQHMQNHNQQGGTNMYGAQPTQNYNQQGGTNMYGAQPTQTHNQQGGTNKYGAPQQAQTNQTPQQGQEPISEEERKRRYYWYLMLQQQQMQQQQQQQMQSKYPQPGETTYPQPGEIPNQSHSRQQSPSAPPNQTIPAPGSLQSGHSLPSQPTHNLHGTQPPPEHMDPRQRVKMEQVNNLPPNVQLDPRIRPQQIHNGQAQQIKGRYPGRSGEEEEIVLDKRGRVKRKSPIKELIAGPMIKSLHEVEKEFHVRKMAQHREERKRRHELPPDPRKMEAHQRGSSNETMHSPSSSSTILNQNSTETAKTQRMRPKEEVEDSHPQKRAGVPGVLVGDLRGSGREPGPRQHAGREPPRGRPTSASSQGRDGVMRNQGAPHPHRVSPNPGAESRGREIHRDPHQPGRPVSGQNPAKAAPVAKNRAPTKRERSRSSKTVKVDDVPKIPEKPKAGGRYEGRGYRSVYSGILLNKRYELRKHMGEGSYATIYEAFDFQMYMPVAIKILKLNKDGDKRSNDVIENEMEMESSVHADLSSHYKVFGKYVPIHLGSWRDEKYGPYIVMQLLGPDLGTVRRAAPHGGQRLSLGAVSRIGRGALKCLEKLHEKGYIHRDLKPQNLLLAEPPKSWNRDRKLRDCYEVYICDFGFAKKHLNDDGEAVQEETRPNFRGTSSYASLRAQEFKDQGRRDDIEALFFVLVELLLGGLPWSRATNEVQDRRERDKNILAQKKRFIKSVPGHLKRDKVTGKVPAVIREPNSVYTGPFQNHKNEINPNNRIHDCPPEIAVKYVPANLLLFLIEVQKYKYADKPNYTKLYDHLKRLEVAEAAVTARYFKAESVESAYKKEILEPVISQFATYKRDCLQYWHIGVCFSPNCHFEHGRTAAPDDMVYAFRGKRAANMHTYMKSLGDRKNGPPPMEKIPTPKIREFLSVKVDPSNPPIDIEAEIKEHKIKQAQIQKTKEADAKAKANMAILAAVQAAKATPVEEKPAAKAATPVKVVNAIAAAVQAAKAAPVPVAAEVSTNRSQKSNLTIPHVKQEIEGEPQFHISTQNEEPIIDAALSQASKKNEIKNNARSQGETLSKVKEELAKTPRSKKTGSQKSSHTPREMTPKSAQSDKKNDTTPKTKSRPSSAKTSPKAKAKKANLDSPQSKKVNTPKSKATKLATTPKSKGKSPRETNKIKVEVDTNVSEKIDNKRKNSLEAEESTPKRKKAA